MSGSINGDDLPPAGNIPKSLLVDLRPRSRSAAESARAFRLKEWAALRKEISSTNAQCFRIELATIGGALAVVAFMLEKHSGPTTLWLMPTAIIAIGGAALWSKGRHLNRLSSYLMHNCEAQLGGPLLNVNGEPLAERKHSSFLDRLSGKGKSPTVSASGEPTAQLTGGWEVWFEQQPYNYTWFQIVAWIMCFILALILGIRGAFYGFDRTPPPKSDGKAVVMKDGERQSKASPVILDEANRNMFEGRRLMIVVTAAIISGVVAIGSFVLFLTSKCWRFLGGLYIFWIVAPPLWFVFEFQFLFNRHFGPFDQYAHAHDLGKALWAAILFAFGTTYYVRCRKELGEQPQNPLLPRKES